MNEEQGCPTGFFDQPQPPGGTVLAPALAKTANFPLETAIFGGPPGGVRNSLQRSLISTCYPQHDVEGSANCWRGPTLKMQQQLNI